MMACWSTYILNTDLDDGCDELFDEVVFEQSRPVVVDEVDEETFDVRAVLILICHDHDLAVS